MDSTPGRDRVKEVLSSSQPTLAQFRARYKLHVRFTIRHKNFYYRQVKVQRLYLGDTYFYVFFKYIYCYFKCTFLSIEPMCQREIFIFILGILMNNKDLFDSIHSFIIIITPIQQQHNSSALHKP